MRRTKSGWPLESWVPEELEADPIDPVSISSSGEWTIRMRTVPIGGIKAQRPPTPREQALMKLALETVMRQNTAAMFGTPITREHAHAVALAAMSERERALIAEDVTPTEEA